MSRAALRLTTVAGVLLAAAIALPGVAEAAWRTAGVGTTTLASGTVGAAAAPSTTVSADQVTLSWEPVELLGPLLVTDRATVVGYRQEGESESGPFDLDASCTDTTASSCTTAQPVGETWRYVVIAALGSWTGPEGAPGAPATVTPPPTATVDFPGGGAVNAAGWDAACSAGAGVCGTAAPDTDGAAITRVQVRVTDPDGRDLDGSGAWVEDEVWRTVLDRSAEEAGEPAPVDWHLALPSGSLAGDGAYTVAVRADDAAGWSGIVGTPGDVVVDRVAPVTTSDAPTAAQSGPTTVTFSATDDRSGVATTEYRTATDAESFTAWTTGTSVTLTIDATHTVQFRSVDVAGNVEATNTATVVVDLSPPAVTLTAPDDATTVLSRDEVTLSATATHPNFAIGSVQFAWSRDGSAWTPVGDPVTSPTAGVYSRTVTLPAGALQLRATATRTGDVTGVSSTRTITVRPEVVSVALVDTATLGLADPGDRVVVTFTDALDPASVCSSFSDPSGPSTATGLTVTFSGNPNVVSITGTGTCGTSGFGTIQVGSTGNGRYTRGNQTLTFSGSTLTWDPGTLELRLTLGSTVDGTQTTGAAAIVVLSPGALTSGGVGLPAGTASSSTEQRF